MATNLHDTVANVLEIVSDLRGESSTNTNAARIRAVSRANQDFAKRKFWRFYLYPNQTTVGTAVNDYTVGSATYPMRYKGLTEVFVALTSDTDKTTEADRYAIVDYNKYKNLYNLNNSEQIVYEWYDVANDVWKMHINPAPAATETITYSYYWEPPELTATTEYVTCPNIKIIALLALGEIYDGEDEQDSADKVRNEAEQLISELIGLDNAPAVNQLYQMYPIESSISSKGIGEY